jgi:hypothetical protein
LKKELELKGHKFHNLRQAMEMGSPHWERLTEEEKEEYRMKSKFSDEDMTGTRSKKRKRLTCLGEDIDELQERLDITQETYEDMVEEIQNSVTGAIDLGG